MLPKFYFRGQVSEIEILSRWEANSNISEKCSEKDGSKPNLELGFVWTLWDF